MMFVIALALSLPAALQASAIDLQKNPVRKVVTMLQDMSEKVTAEGKKEEMLFDKFMCYCKNNLGVLEGALAEADAKIKSLELALEANAEKFKQTKADLAEHTASRDEGKDAMNKATSLREKEAATYAKYKEDSDTNIAAMSKAITAINTGMSGSAFLQSQTCDTVKRFAMEKADIPDETRQELLSFLSGSQKAGYAPQSMEIVGIISQMKDTMVKDLADATATENAAIKAYETLMSTKKEEVDTLQAQIEQELKDTGDLQMEAAEMSNDLEETQAGLSADNQFLVEMKKGCATKADEWKEVCKVREQELLALAETIKILNDDDALELFKKTLPGASSSFMQVQESSQNMRMRALAALREAHVRSSKSMHMPARPQFDLIELALNGKSKGFQKVIAMIDDMVKNLQGEQVDDDAKKGYCEKELAEKEDQKKALEGSISDAELAIEEKTGALATLADEIKALEAGINKLDKAVAEATEQRKEESADYEELMSSDTAAKELLLFAKNRLNKFYNPKLYQPPPKKQLSEEDSIVANFAASASLVEISAHRGGDADDAAPPPPPETFGPYTKKSEESGGVIQMIDLLVADLEKEMQVAKVDEDNAQEEYEKLMADSGAKRKQDSKSLTEKKSAKAETQESLESTKNDKKDSKGELMGNAKEIYALHGECDWLMKFYDVRKDARTGEIDALGKAKAVLSGADFSLLQTRALRR